MQGTDDPELIRAWRRLAEKEKDAGRRANYGAFALVFAEAAGRLDVWKAGLEGYNMRESQQVIDWQQEGILMHNRELLKSLLQGLFGPLPEAWQQRLQSVKDVQRLDAAISQVRSLQKLDDLVL
jgi:hypothetical protein